LSEVINTRAVHSLESFRLVQSVHSITGLKGIKGMFTTVFICVFDTMNEWFLDSGNVKNLAF